MSEEKFDNSSAALFLHSDKKVDEIREKVERLMVEDLDIKHKMDLVINRQDQLKERFEHTSATGFKTWELVQRIATDMEKMASRQTIVENTASQAVEVAKRVDGRFDKVVLGIFVTVFSSVLLGILAFLYNLKGH